MGIGPAFVIHQPAPSEARPDAFVKAARVVSVVWVLAAAVLIAFVGVFATEYLRATVVISVLSGLIALVSLVPGLVNELARRFAPESASIVSEKQNHLGPLFGGIILRMLATVALFVLCRYQLAGSVKLIAALTLGWYVLLTFVEVYILARALPREGAFSLADANTDDDAVHRESRPPGLSVVLPVAMIAEA